MSSGRWYVALLEGRRLQQGNGKYVKLGQDRVGCTASCIDAIGAGSRFIRDDDGFELSVNGGWTFWIRDDAGLNAETRAHAVKEGLNRSAANVNVLNELHAALAMQQVRMRDANNAALRRHRGCHAQEHFMPGVKTIERATENHVSVVAPQRRA